jgi:hypothetical protein
LKKNARNNDSGIFICKIEKKMPKIMILAFLNAKLKKNSRNNDSGIFICKIEKKMPKIMILAFLYV